MKRFISVVTFVLLACAAFSQERNRFLHFGPFLGPSWYIEAGNVGSKEKEFDGKLGRLLSGGNTSPEVTNESLRTNGLALGLDIGFDLMRNVGIGSVFILSVPFQAEMTETGKTFKYTRDDNDVQNLIGFNMVIGPTFFNKHVKLLAGLHLNTMALDFERTKDITGGSALVKGKYNFSSLGIGLVAQGKIFFTRFLYGYADVLLGMDFLGIKNADVKVRFSGPGYYNNESASGSVEWVGNTFNVEITPAIGIGFSFF